MGVSKLCSFAFTHLSRGLIKFIKTEKQTDWIAVTLSHHGVGVTDVLPKGHSEDNPHEVKGQGRGMSHSVVIAPLGEGIHAALSHKLAL